MLETVILETQNFSNASSSINSGMSSSFGLVGPVFGGLVIIVAAVFIGSSVSRIEWVHEKLQAFSHSLYYTIVGLASTVVVGVLMAPLYYLSQADGQTKTYALYAVGGLILAYVVFTGIGYVVDRVVLSTWREYREELNAEAAGGD